MTELPDYADLPPAPGGGRSAWGLFGAGDNLGLVNLMTPERIAAAARLVRRGQIFCLDMPIGSISPALATFRGPPRHQVLHQPGTAGFNDVYDQLAVVLPAQAPETPDEFHRLSVHGEAFPLLEQVAMECLGGCDLGPPGGERLPHGHDPLLGCGHQRWVEVRLVRICSIRSCPDLRPYMGADRGAVAQNVH